MAAKSTLVTKSESQITDSLNQGSSYASKMKINLVADTMKNIPFLADTNPENVLKILMTVKRVYYLNLVQILSLFLS
jgi:hypothetical protein